MTTKRILFLFVGLIFLACAAPGNGRDITPKKNNSDLKASQAPAPGAFVPGELLVRFKPGTSQAAIETVIRQFQLEIIKTFKTSGLFLMRIIDGTPVVEMIIQLNNAKQIRYAEPNHIYSIQPSKPILKSGKNP